MSDSFYFILNIGIESRYDDVSEIENDMSMSVELQTNLRTYISKCFEEAGFGSSIGDSAKYKNNFLGLEYRRIISNFEELPGDVVNFIHDQIPKLIKYVKEVGHDDYVCRVTTRIFTR